MKEIGMSNIGIEYRCNINGVRGCIHFIKCGDIFKNLENLKPVMQKISMNDRKFLV